MSYQNMVDLLDHAILVFNDSPPTHKQNKQQPILQVETDQPVPDLFEEKQKELVLADKSLAEDDFADSEQVRVLKVDRCQNAQKMLNQFVKQMPDLVSVQATGCGVTSLNPFRNARKLKSLDVRDNRIADPAELLALSKLEISEFYAEGNPMVEEESFCAVCHRTFENASIDVYPRFAETHGLIRRISKNGNVPSCVESELAVEFPVDLSYFNFKSGCKTLCFRNVLLEKTRFLQELQGQHIKELTLENCGLCLDFGQLGLHKLKKLTLSGCTVQHLQHSDLDQLLLTSCKISDMKEVKSSRITIRKCDLRGQLTQKTTAQYLELSDCQLSSADCRALGLSACFELNLSGNQILGLGFLQGSKNLRKVDLSSNNILYGESLFCLTDNTNMEELVLAGNRCEERHVCQKMRDSLLKVGDWDVKMVDSKAYRLKSKTDKRKRLHGAAERTKQENLEKLGTFKWMLDFVANWASCLEAGAE